ncbi:MCP methyltransferase, CheR-type [Desulfamplus magnetovallimortis]|uniref:MCP methyltransferase, CheR-type n=1 Tax=Desulfamplus magnetovallimortis TaxID=1246637 RepID=A0A1W1H781_9BACT|nr:protein-glutamate O-methyltransferase CheR [Desulfamplus magnetovallimortis]SLM28317.1 MCP methyltransferase, CheR-type [Desulfamplus magnetovallimortis]
MENEDIEIKLVLKAIQLKHGYDFSNYATASMKRRLKKNLEEAGLKTMSEMIPLIIYDKEFFNLFLHNLSVNVTEMFRDPPFFLSIRRQVIPYLKTYPFIKIWAAGSSTGEEVYSLAILLKEEGISEKCIIYATDFNENVLEIARKGIYPAQDIRKHTTNYQQAGGKESFVSYYHADYNSVIFDNSLKNNIVFANHNLVTDGVFGEMNIIICRNVLIYFNKKLQDQVLYLFNESLRINGFLCLGSRETLDFSPNASLYIPVNKNLKIYQKKKSNLSTGSRSI